MRRSKSWIPTMRSRTPWSIWPPRSRLSSVPIQPGSDNPDPVPPCPPTILLLIPRAASRKDRSVRRASPVTARPKPPPTQSRRGPPANPTRSTASRFGMTIMLRTSRESARPGSPPRRRRSCRPRILLQEHFQNVAAGGADREANSEFPLSLRHRERHQRNMPAPASAVATAPMNR